MSEVGHHGGLAGTQPGFRQKPRPRASQLRPRGDARPLLPEPRHFCKRRQQTRIFCEYFDSLGWKPVYKFQRPLELASRPARTQEGDSRIREYEKHRLKISSPLALRLYKISLYSGVWVFLVGKGGLEKHMGDAGASQIHLLLEPQSILRDTGTLDLWSNQDLSM